MLILQALGERAMVPAQLYEQLKFWLPVVSGFVLVYKGFKSLKKSVDGWAETLFQNHLSHIQEATLATVSATNRTNQLLEERAKRDVTVAQQVTEVKDALANSKASLVDSVAVIVKQLQNHEEKELTTWQSVINSNTVQMGAMERLALGLDKVNISQAELIGFVKAQK